MNLLFPVSATLSHAHAHRAHGVTAWRASPVGACDAGTLQDPLDAIALGAYGEVACLTGHCPGRRRLGSFRHGRRPREPGRPCPGPRRADACHRDGSSRGDGAAGRRLRRLRARNPRRKMAGGNDPAP